MPSRTFAAPARQADELTTLPRLLAEETLSPGDLGDVEYLGDASPVLDFQGRKHIDILEGGDVFYTLQENDTTHTLFSTPGQASVDALLDHLQEHLRSDQVVDEYGDECNLSDVSNDHLAVLQAKTWTKSPTNRSPNKAAIFRPSRVEVLVAGHVAKISQMLEEKHIFVLVDNRNDGNQCMSALRIEGAHSCQSQIVRLEPLVHWGTVTPAATPQFALVFRRDGRHMQYPEYKHLVRRLVDTKAPTYCFDSWEHLWSKRTEARDTMRQLQSTIPQPQSQSYSGVSHPYVGRPALKPDRPTYGAAASPIEASRRLTVNHPELLDAERKEIFEKTLPQLDGTSDYPHANHYFGQENEGHGTVCLNSDCECSADEHYTRPPSLPRSNSFTLPVRTTPNSSIEQSDCSPPFRPQKIRESTAALKVNGFPREKPGPQAAAPNRSYVIGLSTLSRQTERRFGQELDLNSTVSIVPVRRSPRTRKIIDEAAIAKENLPVVRPMKCLKTAEKTKGVTADTKQTRKRKTPPANHKAGKQKKARTMAPKTTKLVQPKPNIDSTSDFHSPPEAEITIRPADSPGLTMHFAKRPFMPAPDGVATIIWETFENVGPALISRICFCCKLASHGTFKKGEQPQIAQCMNRDCRFQWFHYACLNQSDKGKARWGTLTCEYCRNQERFAEQNNWNGASAAEQMDSKSGPTKAKVEAQLPGLGGCLSVVNPYDLGTENNLVSAYTSKLQRSTLGDAGKFGFPAAQPGMLVRAYLNPDAYAELLAQRTEAETDHDLWVHETHNVGTGDRGDEESRHEEEELLNTEMGETIVE